MILPIVKQCENKESLLALPAQITCSYRGEFAERGARVFAKLVDGVDVVENGFVEFVFDSTLEDKPEIYAVKVLENKINVSFRDLRGAINGAATVALLLRKKKINQCDIVDFPDCTSRSFMIDMARGLPTDEDIKNAIYHMVLAKYNRLHLHLIDSKGPCFASKAHPEFKYTGESEQCTLEYLTELEELCDFYGIEVVPEIEIPAHARALCTAHPEFKCQVEEAQTWTLCSGNEDVYVFFEALIKEVANAFPKSKYIHVGTDELEFLDLTPPRICHWDDCPTCQSFRKKYKLDDRQAQFYFMIERIHSFVKANGKKMMMWNDQIDVSKDVPLSRDILIQFWRIANDGRGPCDGCTFNGFLEKGFNVINSYYSYTYVDLEAGMLKLDKLKNWTPLNVPEQSEEYAQQVVGAEMCAWEFGNYSAYPYYAYTTAPALAVFADKLWTYKDTDYSSEDYRLALSEFVFGSDEYTDVFDCVGSLIPPRTVFFYTYNKNLTRDEAEKCMEHVKTNTYRTVSRRYVQLFENILSKLN